MRQQRIMHKYNRKADMLDRLALLLILTLIGLAGFIALAVI